MRVDVIPNAQLLIEIILMKMIINVITHCNVAGSPAGGSISGKQQQPNNQMGRIKQHSACHVIIQENQNRAHFQKKTTTVPSLGDRLRSSHSYTASPQPVRLKGGECVNWLTDADLSVFR